jgi:hypothetical protein
MPKVTEDDDRGVVVIDGREIEGFIDEARCPKCEEARIYHIHYDAYFCASVIHGSNRGAAIRGVGFV